jgi:hypothetical protein
MLNAWTDCRHLTNNFFSISYGDNNPENLTLENIQCNLCADGVIPTAERNRQDEEFSAQMTQIIETDEIIIQAQRDFEQAYIRVENALQDTREFNRIIENRIQQLRAPKRAKCAGNEILAYLPVVIECPVCITETDKPIVMPCGHSVCQDCRLNLQNNGNTCPVCRTQLQQLPLLPSGR